jgi:hypothetical protein
MVPMSHMIVLISHMMVPTITLLGTLDFYLLFKFKIYKKNQIIPTSHIMVLISHLIIPIKWVPYSQKEYDYCKMTV